MGTGGGGGGLCDSLFRKGNRKKGAVQCGGPYNERSYEAKVMSTKESQERLHRGDIRARL